MESPPCSCHIGHICVVPCCNITYFAILKLEIIKWKQHFKIIYIVLFKNFFKKNQMNDIKILIYSFSIIYERYSSHVVFDLDNVRKVCQHLHRTIWLRQWSNKFKPYHNIDRVGNILKFFIRFEVYTFNTLNLCIWWPESYDSCTKPLSYHTMPQFVNPLPLS